jgi:hypothetical protein
MRVRSLALSLTIALTVASTSPLTQSRSPLYRFSCSAQTWPACGLNLVPENAYHRKTLLPTGGPHGQPAVLFEHLQADHQFQYYFGWGTIPGLAAVPQGAARYFRFRIFFEPGVDFAGNQGPWSAKFFIVADGQNVGTNRIVGHIGVGGRNDTDVYLGGGRNIDGGSYTVPSPVFRTGRWYDVEYEFQSSSTASKSDGRIRMRVNGGEWLSSGNFVFTTQGWNTFALGRISQTTLRAPKGRFSYKIAADWEWDEASDPHWHRGSSSQPADAAPPAAAAERRPPPSSAAVTAPAATAPPTGPEPKLPPPSISSISPSSGPVAGGTAVEITGADFVRGAGRVLIGGAEAQVTSLRGSHTLRVVTPPGEAGPQTVRVTNPDGQSGELAKAFSYTAGAAPTTAPPAGAPPGDPCQTSPLVVTRVAWPTTNSGQPSLTFDTGSQSIASFSFTWPGTLTVTDARGCVATVRR